MKKIQQKILKKILRWNLNRANSYYFTILISILVGLTAGLASVLLKNSVNFIKHIVENNILTENLHFLYFLAPAVGILITFIFIRNIIGEKKAEGEGIPKVLYAISKNQAFIKFHETFSKIIASSLTVGMGGSAGLEGPAAATGAAIGSNIGRLFKITYRQKIILIGAATAASISSIFKSPITGIVFALEVIMIDLSTQTIIPILVASVSGLLTSYFLSGTNVLYFVSISEKFNIQQFPYYLSLGIVCGFISLYFSQTFIFFSKKFKKISKPIIRYLIGSSLLGLLVFLFPSLYGEGFEVINSAVNSDFSHIFNNFFIHQSSNNLLIIILLATIVLLKIISTAFTLNAGGVGGIFAPMLFTGANLGLLIAIIVKELFGYHISFTNSSLVAMSGIISGVLHAPLTGIFLIAEITNGYALLFPILIVATTSFIVVRIFSKNNIYSYELAQRKEVLTHHADKNALCLIDIEKLIEKDFFPLKPDLKLGHITMAVRKSSRNIFPVLDDNNNFLGIVTLDRIRKIMFRQELYEKIKVTDIMEIPETAFIIDKDDAENIAEKLQKSGTFNIPVLGSDGKYYGFISRANFFSHYRNLLKTFSSE